MKTVDRKALDLACTRSCGGGCYLDEDDFWKVLGPYLDVVDAISKHFVALSAVGLYAEDRVEALRAVSKALRSLSDQKTGE